ncbi:E3 ubiquitin-protein ligase CHFR isoform X2 [Amia ocellicauda]
MSTNGTVINMSKLVKRQMYPLQNGDVIYFVYRKNEPEQNVAYVFQSIVTEQPHIRDASDTDTDVPSSESLQGSLEIASVETVAVLPTQPPLQAQEEPQPSTSTSDPYNVSGACPAGAAPPQPSVSGPGGDQLMSAVDPAVESPNTGDHAKTEVAPAESPVASALKEAKEEEPERKRRKTDQEDHFSAANPEVSEVDGTPKVTADPCVGKGKTGEHKTDKMEESLTCIICQDLLHDCVSLQPCMHTFCAACYSGWMERSCLCPTCRCPVERIRKNHILNNLVEAYLLQHPEKCRSDEDLKSMDKRNKITQDMLQPKIERTFSDEEGSSDFLFELSDADSESSDISQPFVVCRQCPGYRKDPVQIPGVSTPSQEDGGVKPSGEMPSTSANVPAAIQEYTCMPQGSHVICTCCLQPMPDRRAELNGQQQSVQQCTVCQRPFCHMYWRCNRVGCLGCLAHFSDLNLTEKCLDGALNSNNYESDILKNYLASRGMSWKDMLQESLQALQQGSFYLSDYHITGSAVVCYCCGLRAFKELAYQYRQNIPAAELPAAVTSRPDCYWGRNCRTQVKAHHAVKFNHICEQTRFKN